MNWAAAGKRARLIVMHCKAITWHTWSKKSTESNRAYNTSQQQPAQQETVQHNQQLFRAKCTGQHKGS